MLMHALAHRNHMNTVRVHWKFTPREKKILAAPGNWATVSIVPDLLNCDMIYWSVTWLTEVLHDLLKCDMINWSKMYALLKCGMTYEVRWFTEMWHNPVQHNATYWSVPWLTEMWHGILKWDVCLTDMVWLTELRHGMLKCDITQCSVTQFT